jgi:hypothetical protein
MPTAASMPMPSWSWMRYQKRKKGRDENVSTLFNFTVIFFAHVYVSSHAVVGRLACLTVVPALVIFKVTPPPE